MNISLTAELERFVEERVNDGRYRSSSEVVRTALRIMEKTEQLEADQLSFLRSAWNEGIDSGDAGEIDFEILKQEARARLSARQA